LELLERNKDVILHHAAVEIRRLRHMPAMIGQQVQATDYTSTSVYEFSKPQSDKPEEPV